MPFTTLGTNTSFRRLPTMQSPILQEGEWGEDPFKTGYFGWGDGAQPTEVAQSDLPQSVGEPRTIYENTTANALQVAPTAQEMQAGNLLRPQSRGTEYTWKDVAGGLLANQPKLGADVFTDPTFQAKVEYAHRTGYGDPAMAQNIAETQQAQALAAQQQQQAQQEALKTGGMAGIAGYGQGAYGGIPGAPGVAPAGVFPGTGNVQEPQASMGAVPQVDPRQRMMSNLLLTGYKPKEAAEMSLAMTALDPNATDADIIRIGAGAGKYIQQGESVSEAMHKATQEDVQQQARDIQQMQNQAELEKQRLINAGDMQAAREATNRALMIEDKKLELDQKRQQLGLASTASDNPIMKALGTARAKNLADAEGDYMQYSQTASAILPRLDEAENILKDVDVGRWTSAADWLSDKSGINISDSDARSKRKQLMATLASQTLAQASTLTGAKSDKDIELLEKAASGSPISEKDFKDAIANIKRDIGEQMKSREMKLKNAQSFLAGGGLESTQKIEIKEPPQEVKESGKAEKKIAEGGAQQIGRFKVEVVG